MWLHAVTLHWQPKGDGFKQPKGDIQGSREDLTIREKREAAWEVLQFAPHKDSKDASRGLVRFDYLGYNLSKKSPARCLGVRKAVA